MVIQDIKFDFDDLLIVPASSSDIESRKHVNVYDENSMLPLFTAPMDTVIGLDNFDIFKLNRIYPILPRTINRTPFKIDDTWISIGLKEFENISILEEEYKLKNEKNYILVDIANGNMKKLLNLIKKAKDMFGDKLNLMVGNVANPETYKLLSEAGADYIRVGVGNGGGCWIQGTKVLTKNGYKNIEEINTDDIVLTHTGEWKPVILTHELNYSDNLVEINGEISTEEHQYYVINKKDKDLVDDNNYQNFAYWVKAIDLSEEHLLLEIEKNDI